MCVLFWPGFFVMERVSCCYALFPQTGTAVWVRLKGSSTSPRQIPRKEYKNKENSGVRQPHESVTRRLPEPEVVLLNIAALHASLFH